MKKIILLSIILILTSCTNYQEINNLAITTALSIEYNNNYIITLQIIDGNKENIINYEEEGKTITEAYNKIIKKSPKYIYTNKTNIIILNEELITNKLKETLNYLINNKNIKKETYIFLTKENNILNKANKLNNTPNQNIVDSFKRINNNLSITKLTKLKDIIKEKTIIIPTLILNDNKDIELSNIAIINKNNKIKYLTEEESITYNILTNKVKKAIINLKTNNNYIEIELTKIKSTTNNKEIYITGTAKVLETQTKTNNKDINKYIKNYLTNNSKNNKIITKIKLKKEA